MRSMTFEVIYFYGDPVFGLVFSSYFHANSDICVIVAFNRHVETLVVVPWKTVFVVGDYSIITPEMVNCSVSEVALQYHLKPETVNSLIFRSDFLSNIQLLKPNYVAYNDGFVSFYLKTISDPIAIVCPTNSNVMFPWGQAEVLGCMLRWLLEFPLRDSIPYLAWNIVMLMIIYIFYPL